MSDIIAAYNGSFEGFLSLIFDLYKRKVFPNKICGKGEPVDLFSKSMESYVSDENATRVLKGIIDKSNKRTAKFIYEIFLSEQDGIEMKLLHLIRYIFDGQGYRISDFSDPIIVDLHRVKKMVGREVHRMHAFVRFQETKDNMWACEINPDFNVMPLIGKHFKDRYPAMEWVIFDTVRQYGIHYAGSKIEYITFEGDIIEKRISDESTTDAEKSYQSMWKQYFKSVNIKERNNEKLHQQHVPKRYWKYLIEKQN